MMSKNQTGFTLVELLFVVLLLAVLGVSVMQVIFFLEATSKTAADSRKEAEVLSNISSVFRTQLLSRGTSNLRSLNNSTNVSTIQRNLVVEEGKDSNSVTLRFSSILSAAFEPGINSLVGEKELRYYVDPTREDRPLVLEIWPIIGTPDRPLYRTVILPYVSAFRIRQWQGKAWIANWNNPYGGNPRLLEITIKYSDYLNGPNKVMRFTSPLGANS